MENKKIVLIISSIILLSPLITAQSKQTQALWRFNQNKLRKSDTPIDNRVFDASKLLIDTTRFDEPQIGRKKEDKVEFLPGQPKVAFNQYAGYVTVDPHAGRALYYYFVEAQQSPNTSPLILWLNGGPGCSSLGFGAMSELGPFRVHSDGKTLYINDYAWNQGANVLFLESPAGVGFSYSNTTDDNNSGGDRKTAADNYVFLANWLQRFPEYKNRDVYITGESYAGHYAPQLAQTILHLNKNGGHNNIINLKGIMIGNAVINDETDNRGGWEYLASHALITDDTSNSILKNCDFRRFNPSFRNPPSVICNNTLNEVYNKELYDIDINNIYAPECSDFVLTKKPKKTSLLEVDPCDYVYVWWYLNRPDVQKALHANVTKIPRDWQHCSSTLRLRWTDSPYTILPILKDLMDKGIRVWIYSGDVDGNVPVTSTKLSIKMMNIPTTSSWRPWYLLNEVGGYVQEFERLTFVTVRGSGHEVPTYQPQRALSLVNHFLAGKQLPRSSI